MSRGIRYPVEIFRYFDTIASICLLLRYSPNSKNENRTVKASIQDGPKDDKMIFLYFYFTIAAARSIAAIIELDTSINVNDKFCRHLIKASCFA
jgi:hypothetical protein